MKRTFYIAGILMSAFLLLSSCGSETDSTDASPSGVTVSPPPTVSQTAPAETTVSTETTAAPPSTAGDVTASVPKATAVMFSLTPMDAALFDGALTQDMPYSSGAGVTFPYVGIYDQYEEDGKLHVICSVAYVRFNADAAAKTLIAAGTSKTYGRAVLEKNDDDAYKCDAFDLVGDGEGYGEKLYEFCGPLTELPDKILNGEINPSSTFPDDMQSLYCQITGYKIY